MPSRSRETGCSREQCSFFTMLVRIGWNWWRFSSLTWNERNLLIHHIHRIWHRVTTICFPDSKKELGGMFRHARRTYSMGKFDTQNFEGGILSYEDWKVSHSVPKVSGSKWWLCRKIVWNVTYVIHFFFTIFGHVLFQKKYVSLLVICPSCLVPVLPLSTGVPSLFTRIPSLSTDFSFVIHKMCPPPLSMVFLEFMTPFMYFQMYVHYRFHFFLNWKYDFKNILKKAFLCFIKRMVHQLPRICFALRKQIKIFEYI